MTPVQARRLRAHIAVGGICDVTVQGLARIAESFENRFG
jgi:hypothetical protein